MPTPRPLTLPGLLIALASIACNSGSGSTSPPVATGVGAASTAGPPAQLQIIRIGPNVASIQTQALRTLDINPLFKIGNPLSIKPDAELILACNTYRLLLLDNKGATLSPTKWFLDKSYVLQRDTAELDRDTGTIKIHWKVDVLYVVGFYKGAGAWALLHMISGRPNCSPPQPGDPTAAPMAAPSESPSPHAFAVDPNAGSF